MDEQSRTIWARLSSRIRAWPRTYSCFGVTNRSACQAAAPSGGLGSPNLQRGNPQSVAGNNAKSESRNMIAAHRAEKQTTKPVLVRLFPEVPAGGFCRADHQVVFYSRVRALMSPDMQVLDFGAGRGKWQEISQGYKREIVTLRGRCARLVGLDVDRAVLSNPMVDEAKVLEPGGTLPFPSDSFDMIVSWAVFEHIADPELIAGEFWRILKPGGWICAWTPNKWGYVGIGARLVPNKFHAILSDLLSKTGRKEEDVFPTLYKMNTAKRLVELFPPEAFSHHTYCFNGPPTYYANSIALARLISFYSHIVPERLRQALHVFIQKKRADT